MQTFDAAVHWCDLLGLLAAHYATKQQTEQVTRSRCSLCVTLYEVMCTDKSDNVAAAN